MLKNHKKEKMVSARTLRRRRAQERARRSGSLAALLSAPCPIGYRILDGRIEFRFGPGGIDWLNAVCEAGITVAQLCAHLHLPMHPTCFELVEEDGSVASVPMVG